MDDRAAPATAIRVLPTMAIPANTRRSGHPGIETKVAPGVLDARTLPDLAHGSGRADGLGTAAPT